MNWHSKKNKNNEQKRRIGTARKQKQ